MAPEATQEANPNVNPSSNVAALNTPSQFVNKVSSLPIVNSAFDVAKHLYDGTKEKYHVVETLEKGLVENLYPQIVSVTTKATPAIVTKGLTQLDSLACTSLDILEQRVPLLKEHPSQIVHTVSEKVTEGVTVIDQLVEKALVFSEEQIDYILPEEAAPVTAANGQHPVVISKQEKIGTLSRAQNLGLNISKRLSHKAQQQFASQKALSVDTIKFAHALMEKQLGRLKVNFDAALNLIHTEDVHLRKLFDTYSTELRHSFSVAIEKLEKMSQGAVLETTLNVLDGLSKSLSQFTSKTSQTLQQLSESTTDPILKKCLEGAFLTLNYFQDYSQYLAKFTTQKIASTTSTVRTSSNQPNETVFTELVPETSSS